MDAILTGGAIAVGVVNAFPKQAKNLYLSTRDYFSCESIDSSQSLGTRLKYKIKNIPIDKIKDTKTIYALLGTSALFMTGIFVVPHVTKIIKNGMYVLAETVPRAIHFLFIMYLTHLGVKSLFRNSVEKTQPLFLDFDLLVTDLLRIISNKSRPDG